jgi:hypothetical protein
MSRGVRDGEIEGWLARSDRSLAVRPSSKRGAMLRGQERGIAAWNCRHFTP